MSSLSEENLLCPVCHELFREPVLLSCSHSFCRACLQKWWEAKGARQCPCCKRRSSKSDPPRNLALKNLCEAFLQQAPEHQCALHAEKLKIFCLDHQEPVCVICRDSKTHRSHQFRPIDEAAQESRQELQLLLKPLQEKLGRLEEAKGNRQQMAAFLKAQAQRTERQIRETFQGLRELLQREEQLRVAALWEEEEQKSRRLLEATEALSAETAAVSLTIKAAERELNAPDISFLKSYKATVQQLKQLPLLEEQPPAPGALIDVVKHMGNLSFRVWEALGRSVTYSPVLLDPNTADAEMTVCEGLCGVRSGDKNNVPANPERCQFPCSVLASEGFGSGGHSWGVEVGGNEDWELGVLGEDAQAKGRPQLWRIGFSQGRLTAFCAAGPERELRLQAPPSRIGVQLDIPGGELTFSDLDRDATIHSFRHKFTHRLFPYVYTESRLPVKILPLKVSASVQRPPQRGASTRTHTRGPN